MGALLARPNTLICETEPSDIDAHIALPFVWMNIHVLIIGYDLAGVHTRGLFYSTLLSNIPYCNTQVQ